jgi:predicted Zn-ribbon and HTH transcriptional regulator
MANEKCSKCGQTFRGGKLDDNGLCPVCAGEIEPEPEPETED